MPKAETNLEADFNARFGLAAPANYAGKSVV